MFERTARPHHCLHKRQTTNCRYAKVGRLRFMFVLPRAKTFGRSPVSMILKYQFTDIWHIFCSECLPTTVCRDDADLRRRARGHDLQDRDPCSLLMPGRTCELGQNKELLGWLFRSSSMSLGFGESEVPATIPVVTKCKTAPTAPCFHHFAALLVHFDEGVAAGVVVRHDGVSESSRTLDFADLHRCRAGCCKVLLDRILDTCLWHRDTWNVSRQGNHWHVTPYG